MNGSSRLRLVYALSPSALLLLCACGAGGGDTTHATGSAGTASQGAGSGSGGGLGLTTSAQGAGSGGAGSGVGVGSGSSVGGGANCQGMLAVTIRDFTTMTSPDFEQGNNVDDKGIVTADLGPDDKPVYAGTPNTPTTHGKATFDEWYRDTPNVNIDIPITIQLTKGDSNLYSYDNQAFFPIDGKGFGDEGNNHNFHFTDEVHTLFTYKGGETFTFTGDDDLFCYINKKLVINLGGIHSAETQQVSLDAMASELGLKIGQTYPLDLFGAERHVTESHYRIDTTIDCFTPIPPK